MDWQRDNLPGLKIDSRWKWLLVPGALVQWLLYMFPGTGYSSIAASARHARSPIMTVAFAILFYVAMIVVVAALLKSR